MKRLITAMLVLALAACLAAEDKEARLLRTPDINGDRIVFGYAGDIWTVAAAGGTARRLTSHEGREIFPRISPDGKWIAFSGEYSGSRQVYVIPADGGTPRQLTWYNDVGVMPPRGGFDHIVLDWTPDSRQILIRANRTPYGRRMGKYFLVHLEGGLETPLAIPEGGFGSFSPDGRQIVYTPISREFRTWKRTKGGRAQDIWIYNLETDSARRLTTFTGTDQHPFWFGNTIYFISDRNLKLNWYAHNLESGNTREVTNFTDNDVLWPSGHDGLLTFEKGGRIHVLETATGSTRAVSIQIPSDRPEALPRFRNVAEFVSRFGYAISPSGKRAVFDARGDIFTVPAEKGITYNLTRSQGVREMFPAWSPDGQSIACISDRTGEYEIYLLDPSGKNEPRQLTRDHKVWKYPPSWSPDGSYLLFADMNRKLQLLEVASGRITVVDQGERGDITDCSWSPDGKWIAYSKSGDNFLDSLYVYSLETRKSRLLFSDGFDNYAPEFSACGRYLFFVSKRDFRMNFSNYEFDFVYNRAERIYAVPLAPDTPPLFPPQNDREISPDKKDAAESKNKNSKKAETRIDFNRMADRVVVLPLDAGNYRGLVALEEALLYAKGDELMRFDLEKKEAKTILKNIQGYDVSRDGKKLLYRAGGKDYGIVDVKPGQKKGSGKLNLEHLSMKIDPRKEWPQIFNEGWRIFRDWFYVRNMHGVDWQAIREKYAPLLEHVAHRADLDYIFGEMVGELNAGHTYVNWGDFKRVERVDTGLLGAVLVADKAAGRYRIQHILPGENWNEETRSPLTEQGIDVREGDYIIRLNGFDVTLNDNPYAFLENTVSQRVEITVNTGPGDKNARTFWIRPVASEIQLMYLDWVRERREMVERLSDGRIGYIHVPDTAVDGNRELFKGLYALRHKQALIIDDRYNGGGWSPGKMIEALSRNVVSYWHRRDLRLRPEPMYAHDGPKVMLINHYSSSGGDNFPYWFRKHNLGPLIGTRTWGGLIGYGWSPGLVDGPSFAVPMSGIVGTDGEWVVEGVGIYPDTEVYDRPDAVAGGKDPSLEAAVEYLLKELKKNPAKQVTNPEEPDRSGWFEKEIQ
ncbi:MAG: PD40 domain-containing protein [Candidatus Aminicenantes bacterium]|nr:PD40 domain-containing protein [Candidatus Aminicenantes bacterium]